MKKEIIHQLLNKKITPTHFKNEVLRSDLSAFIEKSFMTINPGTKYLHNWHIDLIVEYLRDVQRGKIKRLIINMPPRNLKSICVSVAFPAFLLGHNPAKRIIVASYSDILSVKHSTDTRLIVSSGWFQNIFPDFKMSPIQNEKHKFATTKNGYRFATSVGGTLTGEGGDILIADDLHNPQQVMSDKHRNRTLDWFGNTFSSRLNDKKNGAIIVVMQRLHPNDLSGHLLEKGNNWIHLCLPAIGETDGELRRNSFRKFRKKGELLQEAREGMDEIQNIRNEMGSFVFSAQYQQKPLLAEGNMVRPTWIQRYTPEEITDLDNIVLSFDTGIKAGENNDPTVCTVWGIGRDSLFLLDLHREWLEYPDLKRRTIQWLNQWKPSAVLIEDKASGQSLIQDIRRETKFPLVPIKTTKDKITRLAAVSVLLESGAVKFPKDAPWLADFEAELYAFPNTAHDDQVDSLSQFLQWYRNRSSPKGPGHRLRRL